jgi:hypothetical protein
MTLKRFTKLLTEREGKKKQLTIAQASELVAVFSDLAFEMYTQGQDDEWAKLMANLILNGRKRARAKE